LEQILPRLKTARREQKFMSKNTKQTTEPTAPAIVDTEPTIPVISKPAGIVEYERLQNDVSSTALALDTAREALAALRRDMSAAADLAEADAIAPRIRKVESELPGLEQRHQAAASILQRRGRGLVESAVPELHEAIHKVYAPKARACDTEIIEAATALLGLFDKRKRIEFEARSHFDVLPQVQGFEHPYECKGIPTRQANVGYYASYLASLEECFSAGWPVDNES
jgi:hypothetical protein